MRNNKRSGVGLISLSMDLLLAVWTCNHYAEEPDEAVSRWVRQYFQKGYKNLKYYWELQELIAEEKGRRSLVRAVLEHGAKEAKDEIPGLQFELGLSEICMSYSPEHAQRLRAELVKYLKQRPDGELEVDYPVQFGQRSLGSVAYYLLRLVDKYQEVPLNMPGNPFTDRNTMAPRTRLVCSYKPIIQQYDTEPPPALVEYLFREYGVEAYYIFRDALPVAKVGLGEFEWFSHVIETTAWRINHGRKDRAEHGDAMEAIQHMAADKAWYSRRYVVHILLKYLFFRTPELVKKLQNDPHPLVRDRAKALSLEPKEKQ